MRSFARSLPLGLLLPSQLLERRWSRTRPVVGPARLAKFVVGTLTRTWSDAVLDRLETNGRAAVLASREGEAMGILAIRAPADGIDRAFWLANLNKVAGLARAPRGADSDPPRRWLHHRREALHVGRPSRSNQAVCSF